MKFILNDPENGLEASIRLTDPAAAAALLMDNEHLAFVISTAIPEHRAFIEDLVPLLPGPCRLWVVAEPAYRWAPHPDLRVVMTPVIGEPGEPGYAVLFAPDDVANRVATTAAILMLCGREVMLDLTAHRGPAPIFTLPAPGERGLNEKLKLAYGLVLAGLKAMAEGKGLDVSRN